MRKTLIFLFVLLLGALPVSAHEKWPNDGGGGGGSPGGGSPGGGIAFNKTIFQVDSNHADTPISMGQYHQAKCEHNTTSTGPTKLSGTDPSGYWTADSGEGAVCQFCYSGPDNATIEAELELIGYLVNGTGNPGLLWKGDIGASAAGVALNSSTYVAMDPDIDNEVDINGWGYFSTPGPTNAQIRSEAGRALTNVTVRADLQAVRTSGSGSGTVTFKFGYSTSGSPPGDGEEVGQAFTVPVSDTPQPLTMTHTFASFADSARINILALVDAGTDSIVFDVGSIEVTGSGGGQNTVNVNWALGTEPTELASGCTLTFADADPDTITAVGSCGTPFAGLAGEYVYVKGTSCASDAACNDKTYRVASATDTVATLDARESVTAEVTVAASVFQALDDDDNPLGANLGKTTAYFGQSKSTATNFVVKGTKYLSDVDDGECIGFLMELGYIDTAETNVWRTSGITVGLSSL